VTILVAGGTSTLGSQIVERLLARQLSVRVLTRDADRVHSSPANQPEFVTGDVRDPASLRHAMRGVDTVISAVQGFVGSGGVTPASVDRDGNIHLIDAARSVGAAFVLMSVVGAAPQSQLELCRMKYVAEEYLRASGLAWSIIRATPFLETWIGLLVQQLEDADLPLEKALLLYEEGMKLSEVCQKQLEEAEGRVEILVKKAGGKMTTQPFATEETETP